MWAYDFVFDTCANRQTLKCLTIVDEWTRECLAIDVAGGIRSRRAIEVLAQLVSVHGAPRHLRSDNGPEFVATAILRWLGDAGIDTALIDPGKPWQNATDESFNGKLRDEFLSLQWFRNRMDAPREGRDDERTAPRAVLAACGWTDTENSDTPEIVAGADWRDDAWIRAVEVTVQSAA